MPSRTDRALRRRKRKSLKGSGNDSAPILLPRGEMGVGALIGVTRESSVIVRLYCFYRERVSSAAMPFRPRRI